MQEGMLIDYISSASGMLPVIAFAYNYVWLDKVSRIIGIFFIESAISDLMQWVFPSFDMKNTPVVHVFVIINIIFFGIIYYEAFVIKKIKTLTIVLSSIALVIALYFTKNILLFPT